MNKYFFASLVMLVFLSADQVAWAGIDGVDCSKGAVVPVTNSKDAVCTVISNQSVSAALDEQSKNIMHFKGWGGEAVKNGIDQWRVVFLANGTSPTWRCKVLIKGSTGELVNPSQPVDCGYSKQ